MKHYSILVVFLCIFLTGCIGVSVFDENGFDNITFRLNASGLNITAVLWEESGGVVSLITPTNQLLINALLTNLTGNMTVNSIDIRSTNSLCFDNCEFIMSAEDFIFFTGGTRRQIEVDTDFRAENNISNGTAFLTVINPSKTPLSKAGLVVGSSDNTGFLILKSNSLSVEPSVTELQNNAGNAEFIQGPMKPNPTQPIKGGEWRFGFYDNFTIDQNVSIISFNNKTFLMTLNQTSGVTIDGDLTIEGKLKYNEIFGELYFPENGDLNVTINSINVYHNITPLYNGYTNSITLSSSTFIIQENGTYFGSYTGSMKDGSSSDFGLAIFVSGQEQNRTHAHFTTLTSNRYTNFAGQGTFSAFEGDIVNLRVQDEKNPASDADFNNINFIIKRIGEG